MSKKKMIIGIHGLLNKPPKDQLEAWWKVSIDEGLSKNLNSSADYEFELVYWADVRNSKSLNIDELKDPYIEASEALPRQLQEISKFRDIIERKGGGVVDDIKEWGVGQNMEKLLGVARLDDLADYYNDQTIQSKIREKAKVVLRNNTDKSIMFVAHSMGSVVAYDVLRELAEEELEAEVSVDHFVTIGSPLGLSKVKHEVNMEFDSRSKLGRAKVWSNLSDPGDKVALDCRLSDDYGGSINDMLVNNTYIDRNGKANNHKSYGYLRTPEFSELVHDHLNS